VGPERISALRKAGQMRFEAFEKGRHFEERRSCKSDQGLLHFLNACATIFSAPSGCGRCSAFASSHGARISIERNQPPGRLASCRAAFLLGS
jgi:hypothetical protein